MSTSSPTRGRRLKMKFFALETCRIFLGNFENFLTSTYRNLRSSPRPPSTLEPTFDPRPLRPSNPPTLDKSPFNLTQSYKSYSILQILLTLLNLTLNLTHSYAPDKLLTLHLVHPPGANRSIRDLAIFRVFLCKMGGLRPDGVLSRCSRSAATTQHADFGI